MKLIKLISIAATLLVIAAGCQKDPFGGNMKVNLTDAPGDYKNVFVDVQKVMIHYDRQGDDKWIELKSNPGVYDLLTLRNDTKILIADGEKLPLGKVSQMRLVLGDRNSIVTNEGNKFDLKVPSSSESGLKINIQETIRHNDNIIITLDFDAASSVKLTGNGEYIMEPVIKVKEVINN